MSGKFNVSDQCGAAALIDRGDASAFPDAVDLNCSPDHEQQIFRRGVRDGKIFPFFIAAEVKGQIGGVSKYSRICSF